MESARDERGLEELLARFIEHLERTGQRLDLASLCDSAPEKAAELTALVARYEQIEALLERRPEPSQAQAPDAEALPTLPGFRTIERLGRGGGGDVFKAEDLVLGRVVAAKLLRRDSPLAASVADFLREARALALFEDPRIVRLLDYRPGDPPVLLMEYVDGFDLTAIGPSLEYGQRARLIAEVAEALEHAHALGLQHRDLKPSHILIDAQLRPKILDFGLSRGEPGSGHGVGTLAYMAPELLDPERPIDARSDIYALGVILYELLCGRRPYDAPDDASLLAAIRAGEPALPIEIEPGVPEPLQAIALKAMSRDPGERYASAREMALDLKRFLEGRPVAARPVTYRAALARRLRPQLEQIADWERLKLIYSHEAERLRGAYRPLEAREDDWIVGSRVLSLSQIALYLGAFLLACGSILYLIIYLNDAVKGFLRPALTLAAPFAALNLAAHWLDRRQQRAVAVAFFLGAAVLLPFALVILFREAGLLLPAAGSVDELFPKLSNHQLQLALCATCLWLFALAMRTRTVALSSGSGVALLTLHLALLGNHGLKHWIDDERWDLIALGLVPLLAFAIVAGLVAERRAWLWLAEPLDFGVAALFVVILELLALNGRALAHLGVTLAPLSGRAVSDPRLLDTIAAMTTNGILIYLAGVLLERHGSRLMRTPARLLCALSPFATLEPLAHLVGTGEYSRRFDWLYLALALGIVFLAERRQRRSFYFAGLINTGIALALLTEHYEWHDRPAWAVAVLGVGVLTLVGGLGFDLRERRRRRVENSRP
jgi:hypothetical protein